MKIAFAHMFTLRTPRGIERYIINMANALSRRGEDVTIIAGRCPQSPTRAWIDDRITIHEIAHHNWHKLSFVPSFLMDFLANDYDVLNLALARGEGYAAGLAHKIKDIRYNVIFHYPYENHEKHFHAFKRFGTAADADGMIAVSSYVARGVRECFGRDAQVVPNGVDPELFLPDNGKRAQLRGQLQIPDDAPVLLTVSALQGRKGIHKVLRAIGVLKLTHPDVRYMVVGDGNEKDRAAFFTQIRSLGLESSVLFFGNQSDVTPYYNAADLFVFLPEYEAFGIVALEAMAAELPVVASQGNAFPEILSQGGGIMVDPNDPESVSETIASLLNDRERMMRIGWEGRRSVVNRFTWDAVASQLIGIFRQQTHF
jgi:glycosyltransferase involved in cell wall biosynthesis